MNLCTKYNVYIMFITYVVMWGGGGGGEIGCWHGCWHGTNRENLYEELGWESMSDRSWAGCLSIFYKIRNGLSPTPETI